MSDHAPEKASALHETLHEELGLDEQQLAQIEELERQFAIKKRALELELRADNARLASAIQAEHGYGPRVRSEEHTSELQSLMRISYAVFCLKTKNNKNPNTH